MSYHYFDPKRENDPYALPNIEVFQHPEDYQLNEPDAGIGFAGDEYGKDYWLPGWYYVAGFPGCLWDSDPVGPFTSEQEALNAAREE